MIRLLVVGTIKDKPLVQLCQKYQDRIENFKLEEVKEANPNFEMTKIIDQEGKSLLSRIKDRDFVVACALEGQAWDSREFSRKLDKWQAQSDVVFVIGGSFGLSESVKQRANVLWSFSPLTFPHQLFRAMVLEQIYRAQKIVQGHPYHK